MAQCQACFNYPWEAGVSQCELEEHEEGGYHQITASNGQIFYWIDDVDSCIAWVPIIPWIPPEEELMKLTTKQITARTVELMKASLKKPSKKPSKKKK